VPGQYMSSTLMVDHRFSASALVCPEGSGKV